MRSNATTVHLFCLLFILSIIHPITASAKQQSAKNPTHRRRRRRTRNGGRISGPKTPLAKTTASSRATPTKLDTSDETLRERWVDLLLLLERDPHNDVRLETQEEEQFYYSAELLADKLLGLEDEFDDTTTKSSNITSLQQDSLSKHKHASISNEISLLWKSIAVGSSGLLIAFPITVMITSIFPPSTIASYVTTALFSVSSILPDLSSTIPSSISAFQSSILPYMQSTLLQTRTVFKSLRHIQLVPLLIKIIRKCIILEAWRHVWIRIYNLSRYMWRGTLHQASRLYVSKCPAFIRRGVKSIFQSMVQTQVHGVMGSVLSGVTFESWAWSASSSSDSDASTAFESDVVMMGESATEASLQDAISMNDVISNSVSDSAAQGFQSTVQDVAVALSDGVEASLENSMDTMSEALESAVEDAFTDSVDASFESAMDSFVEEALPECVDCLVDGFVDS